MNTSINRQGGFTLIELMIVVVVVAILAAIAYPAYTQQVRETRRSEYQGKLMDLAASLENYRARRFSYKDADSNLGSLSSDLDSNDYYTVSISVTNNNQRYEITANPRGRRAVMVSCVWTARAHLLREGQHLHPGLVRLLGIDQGSDRRCPLRCGRCPSPS